ncbi:peptidase inhibitor family I36 protein [Saccharopolyspora rosea]|uniref:Peptidase inhibitor family I36 protein n=1 Tax=Saccharopolyspora rosea TaxID=524884 RepID=A0ABW3FLG1_9PSEU|nr:peptidase inhibitor family I36 protein [Saccharopolyspora rosea]
MFTRSKAIRAALGTAFLVSAGLGATLPAHAAGGPTARADSDCEPGYFCWWNEPNSGGDKLDEPAYPGNSGPLQFETTVSYDNRSKNVEVVIDCENDHFTVPPLKKIEDRPCVNGYFLMQKA